MGEEDKVLRELRGAMISLEELEDQTCRGEPLSRRMNLFVAIVSNAIGRIVEAEGLVRRAVRLLERERNYGQIVRVEGDVKKRR